MEIRHIDHIVLTARDIETRARFYTSVPGMENLSFANGHTALAQGVDILEGPVSRTGAMGVILSFYFREPDGKLIEVSDYRPQGIETRR